jgi:predicted nucleotide-binding protein
VSLSSASTAGSTDPRSAYTAGVTTIDEVKTLLQEGYGLTVLSEQPIQSGVQIVTREGPKVNVFHTGKCAPNGKRLDLIPDFNERLAAGAAAATSTPTNRKVFVVYGHDGAARTQLEAMLRRWGLEPILLDQLTSEGDTLIEKLERSMDEAAFAVVLATPDDEGNPKNKSSEKKFRARQNVVLELGMMLRGLGRKKVAILLQQLDNGIMEKPSDIDGLIYIPFTDAVDDARVQLAKELDKQGLSINLDSL